MAGPVLEYDSVEAHLGCDTSWSRAFDILWHDMGIYAVTLFLQPPTPDDNYLAIVHDDQARDVAYWLVKASCRCEVSDGC